jgi:hypothetical protein
VRGVTSSWRCLAVALTLCGTASCATQTVVDELSEEQMSGIDRGREQADSRTAIPLATSHYFRPPPASASKFRFTQPIGVAVVGQECTVAVADAADQAIHFFRGRDGTYLRSAFLGGRD